MSAFFMYIRQDRSYNSTENICEKKYLFDNKDFNKISAKAWLDGNRFCVILTKGENSFCIFIFFTLNEEFVESNE